jgi:hypothetical protein
MSKKKPWRAAGLPAYRPLDAQARAALDLLAPGAVRRIVLAIAALPEEDNRKLWGWLHNVVHPDWQIVQTGNLDEIAKAIDRLTKERMRLKKLHRRKPTSQPEAKAYIVSRYHAGQTYGQIALDVQKHFPTARKKRTDKPIDRAWVQAHVRAHWNEQPECMECKRRARKGPRCS